MYPGKSLVVAQQALEADARNIYAKINLQPIVPVPAGGDAQLRKQVDDITSACHAYERYREVRGRLFGIRLTRKKRFFKEA
jgi:hypothetical protein